VCNIFSSANSKGRQWTQKTNQPDENYTSSRLTTLPCKKKIVKKPPRNSAGFCGGGQGLSWAVEPRKEEEEEESQ
jgi:hypothetical protein